MNWFKSLSTKIQKTSKKFSDGISDIFTKKIKIDNKILEELEELLIQCDVGPNLSHKLVQIIAKKRFEKEVSAEDIKSDLCTEIYKTLLPCEKSINITEKPHVILVSGINGSGKTTTIGKLAYHFQNQGKKVSLVAADTFRVAAVEQLLFWGNKLKIPVYFKDAGADSASLCYESYQKSLSNKDDILIIDTAGRLHTRNDLMDELVKIKRVLQKLNTNIPHTSLLTLDTTIGQNAYNQIDIFYQKIKLNGLVLTKLDGSAKGGVVIGLADKYKIPIYYTTTGEDMSQLQEFNALLFSKALFTENIHQ